MISQLRVQNFRSHIDYTTKLSPSITIITGPNGSGKTSLLEAIYLSFVGKSYRSNFDNICRQADNGVVSPWWRIDINDDETSGGRTIKYRNRQKEFIINDKLYKRLPQSAHVPVILFEPNDMQLLYGSPARRRQFIDRFIAQIEPVHQTELSKFERVLRQRNNLLKQEVVSRDEMMVWDIQFSQLSASISRRRRQMIRRIVERLNDKYGEISAQTDTINLRFCAGAPAAAEEILARLTRSRDSITPLGAQKDDYKFIFNRQEAKVAASRGENRTILFALLGVITDITRALKGDNVYVLLDDIDSELDMIHRRNLYNMSSFQQNTVATTLDYSGNDHFNVRLSE